MNAILSFLGMAMLVLVSAAAVLAIVILLFYEAIWIIKLGGQLHRSTWIADLPSRDSHPKYDKRRGD